MRTLSQITAAIRSDEKYTETEARYAIVAYDVLMHQLSVEQDPVRLAEYFKAAETPPIQYVGWANNPANPNAVNWYKSMINVGEQADEKA